MNRDTISIHFVNAALTGVRRMGLDVNALLSRVGIEPELLSQPKARVSPDQYTRLAQTLWLVTQDEHLGFDAQPRRLGTFSIGIRVLVTGPLVCISLTMESEGAGAVASAMPPNMNAR